MTTIYKENTAKVIINEQHSIMPYQREVLDSFYEDMNIETEELVKVPADGWTIKQQIEFMKSLRNETVIFISPIPFMIKELSISAAKHEIWSAHDDINEYFYNDYFVYNVFVMANDTRTKKELPNGKIISTVAETGWYIA